MCMSVVGEYREEGEGVVALSGVYGEKCRGEDSGPT